MIRISAGMQNLHRNLPALRVNRVGHNFVLLDLVTKAELGSERTDAPGEIRGDAACDDETHAASRALSEVHLDRIRVTHNNDEATDNWRSDMLNKTSPPFSGSRLLLLQDPCAWSPLSRCC